MSISIGDYQNGTLQNLRTTSAAKLGQQDSEAEAGKTQESAVSASLDQVNMGEDGIAITEASRQQGTEQSGAQKYPAVPNRDTVEISEAGKAASAALQTQAEGQSGIEDLSEYTDTELKQMYYRGEITRQEYEEETGEILE